MFVPFLVLAVIGLLALIGGAGWALKSYGKTRRWQGPQVGAEIMRGEDDDPGRVAFAGTGVAVEREVDVSLVDLKAAWLAGHRREVLPFAIAMAGFVTMLVFGGLALLIKVPMKAFGLIVLAAGLYAAFLMVRDLVKGDG